MISFNAALISHLEASGGTSKDFVRGAVCEKETTAKIRVLNGTIKFESYFGLQNESAAPLYYVHIATCVLREPTGDRLRDSSSAGSEILDLGTEASLYQVLSTTSAPEKD